MKFEYRFIRLRDEQHGDAAALAELNRLGAEGWELMPFFALNGQCVMRRQV